MEFQSGSLPAFYDDPKFFAAYDEMRTLGGTLNEAVEMPALISLMPALKNTVAADLGCGMGSMCRWLIDQGAASVTGYDASDRMLSRAQLQSQNIKNLHYVQADLEQLNLPENSFRLIISGLALHYVADFKGLGQSISAALKPGGSFIFSVEHPVITCNQREWVSRVDGTRAHWPVDRYLEDGGRVIRWMGFDDVPRQHRTVAGYVNTLLDAGLVLQRLLEPGPSEEAIANWPRLAGSVALTPYAGRMPSPSLPVNREGRRAGSQSALHLPRLDRASRNCLF